MNRIRIGKDININWPISATDQTIILSEDTLTLEMTLPNKCIANLPFTYENGVLNARFFGIDQEQLGSYWLTVWYNKGQEGQTCVDKRYAFTLVQSTEEETSGENEIAFANLTLDESSIGDYYTAQSIDYMLFNLQQQIGSLYSALYQHISNDAKHVSTYDRQYWNSKQDPTT